jgi:hypothetical protein
MLANIGISLVFLAITTGVIWDASRPYQQRIREQAKNELSKSSADVRHHIVTRLGCAFVGNSLIIFGAAYMIHRQLVPNFDTILAGVLLCFVIGVGMGGTVHRFVTLTRSLKSAERDDLPSLIDRTSIPVRVEYEHSDAVSILRSARLICHAQLSAKFRLENGSHQ